MGDLLGTDGLKSVLLSLGWLSVSYISGQRENPTRQQRLESSSEATPDCQST